MGFMICHMQKLKNPAIKGIQIHNQREKDSRSNPDIDPSKSEQNYDLIHERKQVEYKKLIQERIDEGVNSDRAIRKDAVVCCSFMISASPEYMKSLSPEEEKRFFKESLNFLKERYGKKNFIYATVHKDEKTPHMHVGFVPINDKQKLSAYSFFKNKSELQNLQDKIYEHIKGKGFNVERGISSDRKHLSTQRFKAETIKQEIQLLEKEKQKIESRLSDLTQSLDNTKRIDDIKPEKAIFDRKNVKLDIDDFEALKIKAKATEALKIEKEEFNNLWIDEISKSTNLEMEKDSLKSENTQLKKANKELKEENMFLKQRLNQMDAFMKESIPRYVERFKTWVKEKQVKFTEQRIKKDNELER